MAVFGKNSMVAPHPDVASERELVESEITVKLHTPIVEPRFFEGCRIIPIIDIVTRQAALQLQSDSMISELSAESRVQRS